MQMFAYMSPSQQVELKSSLLRLLLYENESFDYLSLSEFYDDNRIFDIVGKIGKSCRLSLGSDPRTSAECLNKLLLDKPDFLKNYPTLRGMLLDEIDLLYNNCYWLT